MKLHWNDVSKKRDPRGVWLTGIAWLVENDSLVRFFTPMIKSYAAECGEDTSTVSSPHYKRDLPSSQFCGGCSKIY